MSSLEAAIAHIEAVTGQEFGEWPREMSREEEKELAKKHFLEHTGALPGFKNLAWFLENKSKYETTSRYHPEEHAISVNPQDEKETQGLVRTHECVHAFEHNHWKALYARNKDKEEMYMRSSIQEGIADYITLLSENEAGCTAIRKKRGKVETSRSNAYILFYNLDDGDNERVSTLAKKQKYALGLALAEAAVEQAGNVWTGLDTLARNPPRTIDEAYDMLAANGTNEAKE